MKTRNQFFYLFLAAGLFALLGGCAGAPVADSDSDSQSDSAAAETQRDAHDPFERFNRAVLNFNFKVDRYALKPAAKVYEKLPQPVRNGVGNFFSNLWMPNTIVNDLLQGKLALAGRDTGRFMINTVVGLFGLMDVASEMGLPNRREDFGQTLAVWGVPSGPYLVLPLLGPSNLRDTTGLVPQFAYTDALSALESPEAQYASGLRLLDIRAGLLGVDETLELQGEAFRYYHLRDEYRQRRARLIHDGNPPADPDEVSEDELLDELLEDEDVD